MAGTVLCAAGGLAGAVFALPLRGIKSWKYESGWLVYSVSGLLLFPVILALVTVNDLWGVIGRTDGAVLRRCFCFGMLWGIGGLTWGLMIRYLGIGLGLAIGCGLCSAAGTLIPPLVAGRAADLVKDSAAIATLASVAVSLAGIAAVGFAGMLKEREVDDETKKKAVADFNFGKGMTVAIFSGIASAGMNFGLQSGKALESAAAASGTASQWTGMPVLVVVLLGGFVVNATWCLVQNAKNSSFGDYRNPRPANWFCGMAAGVVWAAQFACQKAGEPAMGDMAYVSFAVVMGSCVLFSSLLGVVLGEWRGTGAKTRAHLCAGLLLLAASIGLAVFAKGL